MEGRLGTSLDLHPILRFSFYFLTFYDPKTWNLALIGWAEAIVLCSFLFYDMYLLFFCTVYIFYISVLAPARICSLFRDDRCSQAKMSTIWNKLYLQMLLDNTCLLVSSTRDFRILSCILTTVYMPKAFLKEPLINFGGIFPCYSGYILIQRKCV